MTTRDPRSRGPRQPEAAAGRDPTQSLDIGADEEDDFNSHPSLAIGTADAQREERTKVESPNARGKTPLPAPPTKKPPPIPRGGIDEPDRIGTLLRDYRVVEVLGK